MPPSELAKLVGDPFPDMVKFVVDVERSIVAVGGELHADGQALLLEHGSRQAALWGGNYYPSQDEGACVVFESIINIRPSAGNPGLQIQDVSIRAKIRDVIFALLGRGRPRP